MDVEIIQDAKARVQFDTKRQKASNALEQKRASLVTSGKQPSPVSVETGNAPAGESGSVPSDAGRPVATAGGGRRTIRRKGGKSEVAGQPALPSSDDSAGGSPDIEGGNKPTAERPGGRGEPVGGLETGGAGSNIATPKRLVAAGKRSEGESGRTGTSELSGKHGSLLGPILLKIPLKIFSVARNRKRRLLLTL